MRHFKNFLQGTYHELKGRLRQYCGQTIADEFIGLGGKIEVLRGRLQRLRGFTGACTGTAPELLVYDLKHHQIRRYEEGSVPYQPTESRDQRSKRRNPC